MSQDDPEKPILDYRKPVVDNTNGNSFGWSVIGFVAGGVFSGIYWYSIGRTIHVYDSLLAIEVIIGAKIALAILAFTRRFNGLGIGLLASVVLTPVAAIFWYTHAF